MKPRDKRIMRELIVQKIREEHSPSSSETARREEANDSAVDPMIIAQATTQEEEAR
jgi:hypothetical protein